MDSVGNPVTGRLTFRPGESEPLTMSCTWVIRCDPVLKKIQFNRNGLVFETPSLQTLPHHREVFAIAQILIIKQALTSEPVVISEFDVADSVYAFLLNPAITVTPEMMRIA